jgi:hypothetical protein
MITNNNISLTYFSVDYMIIILVGVLVFYKIYLLIGITYVRFTQTNNNSIILKDGFKN